MPNYVTKSLQKFQHPTPSRSQYAHHQWTRLNYGATNQLENTMDASLPIPEEQKHMIQKIVITLLYYDFNLDCTMLQQLKTISDQQAHPNHNAEADITHLLDFVDTNPTSIVQFKASDMLLHIGSDS